MSCSTNDNSKTQLLENQETNQRKKSKDNEWILEKIDSSKLVFKNGKTIETRLFNLEFIGQIPLENKDPFLIFSGVDCNFCDANISIYIHSPSDGDLIVGAGKNIYGMPGRMYSFMNDSLLYESRVFYGQVLENRKGVIWYQNTLMETGKWDKSVFTSELLKQTLSMLDKGLCKEIEGNDYSSEP
jgi:hypothetical protein